MSLFLATNYQEQTKGTREREHDYIVVNVIGLHMTIGFLLRSASRVIY